MAVFGSHNSITANRPSSFWGWFAIPFARCQKKTIKEQYDAGVRCFDLRITFEESQPVFAHGITGFEGSPVDVLYDINQFPEKCYVRIILEDTSVIHENEDKFYHFCKLYSSLMKNITFFEGRRRCDWKLVYGFQDSPQMYQAVGSMAKDARWYERLIPWFYAKRMNENNMKIDWKSYDIVIYDFV